MATNHQNLPISSILKSKSEVDDEPKKKSREDWRKAKELEEARKAGTAPAAVDEEGKDINPHIPQYISNAPWYYGTSGPTLKHQRPQEEKQKEYSNIDEWYKRGVDTSKIVTKYRKGACENCGAMTHKKKDCMERPRKVGAKFSGANIAPDEFAQKNLALSFDGKRDRWSGYDPSEHKAVIEEFQKVEEAKRQLKADKLNANESSDDEEKDEDKYVDEVDMPGTKVDSKQRITVRNLRIREDTAKYLRNLDLGSAYYDPKTRSMRENPNPEKDATYSGENFVRFTGDTTNHAKAQLFAWEAYEKGVDVHLLAEPTKLELLKKEYEKKKEQVKSTIQGSVLDKYGGQEHLEAPPKSLLLAQSEVYVEYSRSGRVITGAEKEVIRSKYEEDVYINNHTSVWGSYWRGGQWGYKCCHSFIKNSYCLGEAGKAVNAPVTQDIPKDQDVGETGSTKEAGISDGESEDSSSSNSSEGEKLKKKQRRLKKKEKKAKKKEKKAKEKLKKKQEKEKAPEIDEEIMLDDRKRPYNSMFDAKKPTEEEMEEYYKKRKRDEDPMNNFM
ncbi:pre-mRNA-splicing factor Slu7 [Diabrotica virgifera virgifera]|uniref:Pre-mRNA-splicing factor SLU7 n=1 Tax=Diabrotica virgifera virgifera TaxID=50390 RepID=A0ABM5IZ97_DIAVI|nr:pre-mRNA-splicing factor Slu7 [Diabrotica virgifera virgifera]